MLLLGTVRSDEIPYPWMKPLRLYHDAESSLRFSSLRIPGKNMPCVLGRFGDCGSISPNCFGISAYLELSFLIIGIDSSLLTIITEGNARPNSVTIMSAVARYGIKCSGINCFSTCLWDTIRIKSPILSTPLSIKRVIITSAKLLDASKALSKALSLIVNSSKETPLESSCIRFTKSLTRSICCSVTVRRTFKANGALSSFLPEHCTASTPILMSPGPPTVDDASCLLMRKRV
ncbi:hypothetical protein GQX74_015537 [Glossina fuscipes]|nr:hypothetical protein GQX74_015537 [Glossina fuscipes]